MKKIPTIFARDWQGDRSRVLDIRNPDCQWVFDGEGIATRKLDGTCCLVDGGDLYKRREVKAGKLPPDNFMLVEHDKETDKRVGWVPVGDGKEDQYYREAWVALDKQLDGTYELIGPKVQGNPEKVATHQLIRHGDGMAGYLYGFDTPTRNFQDIRANLAGLDIEGIVFRHPDGRMGKIKLRDFGWKRGGLA